MHHVIDDLGREIFVTRRPERIVTLCPSQTELLFDLGLGDRIVGVTKFCIHPKELVGSKTRVGGTKDVRREIVRGLAPDFILAQKEENDRDTVLELAEDFPVYVTDVPDVRRALAMIERVGEVLGVGERARSLAAAIRDSIGDLPRWEPLRVVYLIWRGPWMAAGRGTFIDSVLSLAGFVNCVDEERYPELNGKRLSELAPDLVLLSSEPFPFREKHRQEVLEASPSSQVHYVDGEVFSWYGSRMQHIAPAICALRARLDALLQ